MNLEATLAEPALADKFKFILPLLNERQRRLYLASEARVFGHGGITLVARASGVSHATIAKGLEELESARCSGISGMTIPGSAGEEGTQESSTEPSFSGSSFKGTRIRKEGAGRPRTLDKDPTLLSDLEKLIDPQTRGDPMSPLRWTCKSTRHLAQALEEMGHKTSHVLVSRLLHQMDYSLQANRKTLEGSQHPDRDEQFRYIAEQAAAFLEEGQPVVSMDAKKKELVGEYKNPGQEWQPQEEPEEVLVHDFPNQDDGKAIPYGVYDVGANVGWVNVGWDHDTGAFAIESLRRWWEGMGHERYPEATKLLVSVDAGGSNGYRLRLFKTELDKFAQQSGLAITVCHLPPGTSKWNKIEHRLFSYITMNWRGRPLISFEAIIELIEGTTTQTGLKVYAELDTHLYPTKIKISDEELAAVHLIPHPFHGEWNYTITPAYDTINDTITAPS